MKTTMISIILIPNIYYFKFILILKKMKYNNFKYYQIFISLYLITKIVFLSFPSFLNLKINLIKAIDLIAKS